MQSTTLFVTVKMLIGKGEKKKSHANETVKVAGRLKKPKKQKLKEWQTKPHKNQKQL